MMTTQQDLAEDVRQQLQNATLAGMPTVAAESPADVQQALPRVVALVLSSLAEMADAPSSLEALWQAIQSPSPSPRLVRAVLEDRYHGTVHVLATATSLPTTAIAALLDAATVLGLKGLGQVASEQHWNAAALKQWLHPYQAAPVVTPAPLLAVAAPAGGDWRSRSSVLLLIAGFLAVGEVGYLLGRYSADGNKVAAENAVPTARPYAAIPVARLTAKSRPAAEKAAVPVVLKLNNGLRQVIGATSTESKLYQFLIDPSREVDTVDPTRDWIGFDRIYFETNKALLTNESLWQLSNVASILKRFPEAKIKLGGYTDSAGPPLVNLRLSQARAQAALDALAGLGVPASRLTAVGYGALDPIASNDTEEGRSVNRRVSMQVVQK